METNTFPFCVLMMKMQNIFCIINFYKIKVELFHCHRVKQLYFVCLFLLL